VSIHRTFRIYGSLCDYSQALTVVADSFRDCFDSDSETTTVKYCRRTQMLLFVYRKIHVRFPEHTRE
jgi:hypothetical protein